MDKAGNGKRSVVYIAASILTPAALAAQVMLIRYYKYVSFDNFYEPHKVYAVLNFGPVVIAAFLFLKLIFQRDTSRKVSLAVNSACLVLFAL